MSREQSDDARELLVIDGPLHIRVEPLEPLRAEAD
jgi:hypothetical protein